jgi:hypothetical protein
LVTPTYQLMGGVQPVEPAAYEAIVKLGTKGGWGDLMPQGKKQTKSAKDNGDLPADTKAMKPDQGGEKAAKSRKTKKGTSEVEAKAEAEVKLEPVTKGAATPTRMSSRAKRKAVMVDQSDSDLSDPPEVKPKRERKKR